MFRCQICETVVPPGTRTQKVVVQTRAKKYEPREKPAPRGGGGFRGRGMGRGRRKMMDPGGEGREIVRELTVCPECAKQYDSPPMTAPEPAPIVPTETESSEA